MSLPKGLNDQSKIFSAFCAQNVQAQEATNPNTYFLFGRTLLDKPTFNKINDNDHDTVHGISVMYGPFDKQSMFDFVTDYKNEWPGNNEWSYINPGKPFILSGYYEPGMADIVHNKSLDFQGQITFNSMQQQIDEIKEVQNRLSKKEPEAMTQDELTLHIKWQEDRISGAEKVTAQLKKHLERLKSEYASKFPVE